MFRATPLLGGGNTQHVRWWRQAKGQGKPGAQSTWWGAVQTSKGKGYPEKGHWASGDKWGHGAARHNQAPAVAPAVVPGKGGFSWGGRGRGWGQRVPQVPFCSSPPGCPPRREEQTLPGSNGRGMKGRQPGAWSQQPRGGWNPEGQGYPRRDHCSGGDQRGKERVPWNKALFAAPAMVLGKGALPWGGRGRGWVQRGCPGALL